MTDRSRAFDDLANLLANAAGAVKGLSDEAKAVGRARAEKMIAELDLVTRDEFEVTKARVVALEARLAELEAGAKPAAKKAAPKKPAAKKTSTKRTSKTAG